jgi:hypothetical protein
VPIGHDTRPARPASATPTPRSRRRNGLSWAEIREVLLQTAVCCGVPAADTAFRVAQQVLDEED